MNQAEADKSIAEVMEKLNELQAEYDARILAAVCLSKAQYLYRNLRQLGVETPETLVRLYEMSLNEALTDGELAKVQNGEGQIISTTRN